MTGADWLALKQRRKFRSGFDSTRKANSKKRRKKEELLGKKMELDDSGFISPEAIRSADVFESKKEKKIDQNENSTFLTPSRTQKPFLPTRRSRAKRKSDFKNEPVHLLVRNAN